MKKRKTGKTEMPAKSTSAALPANEKEKKQTADQVEELFGVHIISDADIENHFGNSGSDPNDESKDTAKRQNS